MCKDKECFTLLISKNLSRGFILLSEFLVFRDNKKFSWRFFLAFSYNFTIRNIVLYKESAFYLYICCKMLFNFQSFIDEMREKEDKKEIVEKYENFYGPIQ